MDFQANRLTPAQAAEYLGLSQATLDTWRCTRTTALPFYRVGRRIFYSRSDLDAFLKKSRVETPA